MFNYKKLLHFSGFSFYCKLHPPTWGGWSSVGRRFGLACLVIRERVGLGHPLAVIRWGGHPCQRWRVLACSGFGLAVDG